MARRFALTSPTLRPSAQHRKDDFAFLWAGVEDVLFNHLTASSGLLPGANKPPPLLLETCA